MNGRITDEVTPARRISALAFSVVLQKFEEWRRNNPTRMNDFIHVEEFLDYGDFIEPVEICLKREFALSRLDEMRSKLLALNLELDEATRGVVRLNL